MSQAGYTPIQLYFSTTAAAVPVNTNLANGELAINIQDEKLYFKNAAGTVKLLASNATSAPVLSFSAGTTGFTPSTATSGAITLAGTLATTNGGTGLTSFTSGGVVYASSSSALATGSALTFDGTNFGVGLTATSPIEVGLGSAKYVTLRETSSNIDIGIQARSSIASGNNFLGGFATNSATGETRLSTGDYFTYFMTFYRGGTEAMRLTSTGLGIGTSSPSTTLQVGDANTSGKGIMLRNGGGASRTAYITLIGTTAASADQTWYSGINVFASNGSYELKNAAGNGLTLDTSANLGLGIAPSAWGNTFKAFDIGAGGTIAGNTDLYLGSNIYYNGTNYIRKAIGYAPLYIPSASTGQHQWFTSATSSAGSTISFTQAMTLDASGNLLVGTTSINRLGSGASGTAFQLAASGTPEMYMSTASVSSGDFVGTINFGTTGTASAIKRSALIGSVLTAASGTNVSGDLQFYTNNAGTLGERLRITSTGAFGLSGANYGTSGQVLTSGGSGAAPTWTTVGGGGGSAATPTALGTVYGSTGTGTNAFGGYNAGVANTSGIQNTAFGSGSLSGNISDSANTAVGSDALRVATAGDNTAVGARALYNSTTGAQQTAIGRLALNLNTTGTQNVSVGHSSLQANLTGSYNTALGTFALTANTASENTAVGFQSSYSTTTGTSNVSVGAYSLYTNTSGTYNVAIGHGALDATTTASNTIAIGRDALGQANVATSGFGGDTVAIGYRALYSAGTVASNGTGGCTAVGHLAGYSTASAGNGAYDTFIGFNAGYNNASGSGCTFVGAQAGYGQTSGDGNTIIGDRAGRQTAGAGGGKLVAIGQTAGNVNSGNNNTFVGASAGAANTSQISNAYFGTYAAQSAISSYNVAIGAEAMYSTTSAANNVAVGYAALRSMTNASGSHVAVGYQALYSATDNSNTAVGYRAGYGVTSGHNNTLLGTNAGNGSVVLTGGAQNVVIGSGAYTNTAGAYGEIVIGAGCNGLGNDRVSIGKLNSRIWAQYDSSGSWTYSSDVRLKKDIEDDSLGLSFINKLRPVKYRWKATNELELDNPQYNEVNNKNTTVVMHGLIAQEVKAALDEEGVSTFAGWAVEPNGIQSVSREMFITPLINAVQELTAQIETLKAEVAALKGNV